MLSLASAPAATGVKPWQSIGVNVPRHSARSPDWERSESFRLPDRREMVLRPVQPEDAEPIAAAYELLDEDEVRRRFLHRLKSLDSAHLQQVTRPDPANEFVVVAAEPLPPGEALVAALARLSRDEPGSTRAEFGILVSHFVVGLGLGRMLMERLIEWCRGHGVQELWGDVLEENRPMLELASELGFRREARPDAPNLLRVRLDLRRGPTNRRRKR